MIRPIGLNTIVSCLHISSSDTIDGYPNKFRIILYYSTVQYAIGRAHAVGGTADRRQRKYINDIIERSCFYFTLHQQPDCTKVNGAGNLVFEPVDTNGFYGKPIIQRVLYRFLCRRRLKKRIARFIIGV